jgi:hypothetical protein
MIRYTVAKILAKSYLLLFDAYWLCNTIGTGDAATVILLAKIRCCVVTTREV